MQEESAEAAWNRRDFTHPTAPASGDHDYRKNHHPSFC